jgi:fatty acid-binding protein DegV
VVDSGNTYAGQGIQIIKLVELLRSGLEHESLRQAFDEVVARTTSFFIPVNPRNLYTQTQNDFDPTATSTNSLFGYAFGSLLKLLPVIRVRHGVSETWHKTRNADAGIEKLAELLDSAVQAKTIEPLLNVSYGGALKTLSQIAPYQALRKQMRERGVKVHESQMCFSGAVRLGPGAFGFGVMASAKDK